jgi:hypothetical protein
LKPPSERQSLPNQATMTQLLSQAKAGNVREALRMFKRKT